MSRACIDEEDDGRRTIGKATLFKHFKPELANGRAMLKARVAGKFYHALDCNEPWAVQMAMRNQFGWDAGRGGFHVDSARLADDSGKRDTSVNVFVVPGYGPSGRAMLGKPYFTGVSCLQHLLAK
jgi:hypothetical protein